MLHLAAVQALRRWTRSAAVILAIVMASVSFALLTSAVATSRLQVQGTVDANFQNAYDILVRPSGSTTSLERSQRLVQENYLSGIYGGITLQQYQEIAKIPGVEVAAPVALIGYTLPALQVQLPISKYLNGDTDQLLAMKPSWSTDRGLTHLPDRQRYFYVTRRRATYGSGHNGFVITDPTTGKPIAPCDHYEQNAELKPPRSAFDLARKTELVCTTPGRHPRLTVYYQFPMLIAAIDPVAEATLVGLDHAVTSGRYLTEHDRTFTSELSGGRDTFVPAIMAGQPLTDDTETVQLQRIDVTHPEGLADRLSRPDAPSWLTSQTGTTLHTFTFDDQQIYPRLLTRYRTIGANTHFQYWRGGPIRYERAADGSLAPRPSPPVPADTYRDDYFGDYFAPQVSRDLGFRQLITHEASTAEIGGAVRDPNLHLVGVFDPSKIEGFSTLSKVPLTTFYPPDAAPADARSAHLLGGRPLLPNANLTGYLQQPPTILTTLASLPAFFSAEAFADVTSQERQAPISVIQIRVAGVHGADDASRERVRVVAERIARETGLTVDITSGSSPTPETIDLAAGHFGRPALEIKEGWVKKGVSVLLLSSVDRKSLALFVLVLLVCLLFLSNATVAAVRTRRSELGVLACLGWSAARIFALLEAELLVTGLIAGLVGTGLAAVLVGTFSLHVTWWHLTLITPVATLLACLAGVWPAWRASHTTPIEAIQPAAVAPRRAQNVNTLTKLAWVGVRRVPGRTILGAASLFVGVGALAVLIAIQRAFQGQVTGTVLGDYIAVQVRGVDYLAAAITIALGAFAVADICYLNISERTAEIGILRSTGWSESHLQRLFGTEAFITAVLGACAGAVSGVVAAAVLLPIDLPVTLGAAAVAAGGGILAAMVAVALPLARIRQLAPAASLD